MDDQEIQCSYCARKRCFIGDLSQAPDFCPSLTQIELIDQAKTKLMEPENKRMAQDVARTWKDYGRLTRVEETILYAKLRGCKKLGLAFCVGLSEEAELFSNLLLNEGFEVVSVSCMCGALSSDDVDLPEEDKIVSGSRQPMCNPIGQAAVLDAQGCELNILLGLCVGDDTLFIKHSKTPVTVLAVKDRVLAHNPLGALYTSRQFYTRLNTRRPKKADK
ncbi:MAG: DUF1847 domain-containing protein [Deltaproteobacteria bacterium]|nr:DUF1847 domain-containing protein [Deltaproteobacteria bacterium]MBW2052100.1 DUF1847 domain-containing protein [Deltaproteobacteria bacterium]MBW2140944.1 DUF1847 domain-containing protein [Deltaproteobacteria bacterium]MBW2324447.1 DUF1847 domain-containing protein [Deltaproteobacteria bacterium]